MIIGRQSSDCLVTQQHEIGLHDVESADVRLGLAVGSFKLRGGASGLMHGTFTFPEKLEPDISHHASGGVGWLKVNHKQPRLVRSVNELSWDIALNDAIPIDLRVAMATGGARLDLSTLNLTSFDLSRSTGSTTVDPSGDHQSLGHVDVDVATGDLEMNRSGRYSAMSSLTAKAATGDLTIDLSGTWERNLDVSIEVATGRVHLRLPGDVGVEIRTKAAISKVTARGFDEIGTVYRNRAIGNSPITLQIDLKAAVGTFELETVDQ